MAVSKVILNNVTQIDVTDKTVDVTNLLSGYTATKNDGTQITGQVSPSSLSMDTTTLSTAGYSLTFSGATYTAVPSFIIIILCTNASRGVYLYYYSANSTSPSPSGCYYAETLSSGFSLNTSAPIPTVTSHNDLDITLSSAFPLGTYIMYYIM